ncbi:MULTISPECIES: hydantoinase/oxoprolinase family protein [Lysinibacillus]|uniref:Hydantoinase/oxoprolinase family protein n=1 Tax=Lysinibacillus varians TaxID=1145276 RepID=A0ABY2T9N8_9BACI|nr:MULTISPECIES: hydantoinase/oxoprolinase family protein [Lysinibacillus]AHN21174.1 hydantoinase [Lysinibacillus varians]MCS1382950.1 hydantoinase/oxoprolinase family protein [Lysinibacillus sphaericus]TKI59532.1 hydantoinase/oxoprolinase family protein [Lysinibacillus varians]
MAQTRLAIDVGGTFTDVFVFNEDTGEIFVTKTSSTPSNPEQGILNGVEKAELKGQDIKIFSHGTTVGTNALIERKLPKTALITTKGFRDVTEIRRGTKEDIWDTYKDTAKPYIQRRDRFEVTERIDYEGTVLQAIDEEEIRVLAKKLKRRGTESIAICFINSYVNGENEAKVKKILLEELPDVYICTSSEVLPEIFEHERMSTTIINAVLGPIMSNYISKLSNEMQKRGYEEEILVLHSGGGVMTSSTVPRYAARLASSGIAAGAIASKHIAKLCGFENAIGLDMGGTSTDISLMYKGQIRITKDWSIEYGYPIGFPSIEILTIGAGGGSLAWQDEGGSLRNGPQSAGAIPGPACYGHGGTEPTNSDANVVLGRLGVTLLDGMMQLDKGKAQQAVTKIAQAFNQTIEEAASAIIEVANANMSDAVRLISVRRGYDPRDFALVAFGGAGPLHAAHLAKDLNIPKVIIPTHPGVAAAMGCLLVDVRHDISKTFVKKANEVSVEELDIQYQALRKEAKALLEEEGISEETSTLMNYMDLRYKGQWRSLAVVVPDYVTSLEEVLAAFHQEHEREFAFSDKDQIVEIYGLRVTAIGTVPKPNFPQFESTGSLQDAYKETRPVYFDGAYVETNVYYRDKIPVHAQLQGPAIVDQLDTTTVIPPGFTAEVDAYKNIIITVN